MSERPTGISCQAAKKVAKSGGAVVFGGREARVVSLNNNESEVDGAPLARLELDLGEEYLTLHGYCARNGEFIETRRERPFMGGA